MNKDMKLKTLENGTKLKVTKDIYYIVEGDIDECEFMTYEELMHGITKVLVKDDVYEVIEEDGDKFILCIEGSWEGDTNDGWFDVDDMLDKGALEIIK
jgi:hypothetical protein